MSLTTAVFGEDKLKLFQVEFVSRGSIFSVTNLAILSTNASSFEINWLVEGCGSLILASLPLPTCSSLPLPNCSISDWGPSSSINSLVDSSLMVCFLGFEVWTVSEKKKKEIWLIIIF